MKSKIFIIITFFCCAISFGQEEIKFEIQEIFLDETADIKKKADYFKTDEIFYENNKYVVTSSCHGEWGGSIFFKNKKSGNVYACSSTCPVAVNEINGKYFVTNSLAHLGGGSDIIEIENPELMSIFKMPEPREIKNGVKQYFLGDTQSKSNVGTKIIWNKYGVLVLTSFQINEKLYHIFSQDEKTFLGTIEKNEMNILNQISEVRIWDYDPRTYENNNGNLIVFFNTHNVSGYIEIMEKQIKISRTK